MASLPSLLDLAKLKGSDQVVGLIEEVTTVAPEFLTVPAMTKVGTSYKISRRIALPTAGFRDVNGTATVTKSEWAQETKEMYFLDVPLQADEAVIKADGRELGDFLALESAGALKAATILLGSQFYYGTSANKGFTGISSQSVGKLSTGGTTNSTSAYLVWLNEQGVSFVVGMDGEFSMKPWVQQYVTATSGTTVTQALKWMSNLSTFIGLQVASSQSVWRVSGITTASGAGLTDARGEALVEEIPLDRRNGLRWFMNRRALGTLQRSRSAIGNVASSAGAWPQRPVDCAGIPITVTDSLVNTETNAGSADVYAAE